MYKNIRRLTKAGEHSIVGASGEFSDFQAINRIIEDLMYVIFFTSTNRRKR